MAVEPIGSRNGSAGEEGRCRTGAPADELVLMNADKGKPLISPRGGDGLRGGAVCPTVNEASALSVDKIVNVLILVDGRVVP